LFFAVAVTGCVGLVYVVDAVLRTFGYIGSVAVCCYVYVGCCRLVTLRFALRCVSRLCSLAFALPVYGWFMPAFWLLVTGCSLPLPLLVVRYVYLLVLRLVAGWLPLPVVHVRFMVLLPRLVHGWLPLVRAVVRLCTPLGYRGLLPLRVALVLRSVTFGWLVCVIGSVPSVPFWLFLRCLGSVLPFLVWFVGSYSRWFWFFVLVGSAWIVVSFVLVPVVCAVITVTVWLRYRIAAQCTGGYQRAAKRQHVGSTRSLTFTFLPWFCYGRRWFSGSGSP